MGMLDDLTPPERQYNCKVRETLLELEQKDRDVLSGAIDDAKSWPARTLSNALKGRGIHLADVTIARHREGICSCSKI